jgi:hypothetical protein
VKFALAKTASAVNPAAAAALAIAAPPAVANAEKPLLQISSGFFHFHF